MVVATGRGHQPRPAWRCLMSCGGRRAAQFVAAASAGDQEMTHAPALCGGFPVLACRCRVSI